MLIDKLKDHLENTSIEELQKEWELVKEFKDTSPTALDMIQCWKDKYKTYKLVYERFKKKD